MKTAKIINAIRASQPIIKTYANEKEYVERIIKDLRVRGYQVIYDPQKVGGDLDMAYGT